jgi:hypothetical protein
LRSKELQLAVAVDVITGAAAAQQIIEQLSTRASQGHRASCHGQKQVKIKVNVKTTQKSNLIASKQALKYFFKEKT